MPYPHCASPATAHQPRITALGYQPFRCGACRRSFNERTGTPFDFLEYPTDVVQLVVLWRLRYKPILRDLAQMFLARFPLGCAEFGWNAVGRKATRKESMKGASHAQGGLRAPPRGVSSPTNLGQVSTTQQNWLKAQHVLS